MVGRPGSPRKAREDDERGRALRVRCGKETAHRSALGVSDESRARRAHCIHHRADVVHACLEVWHVDHAIRKPRSTLVEENETREGGKPPQKLFRGGILPQQVDVRHPAGYEYEVSRSFAHDLVSDVEVTAARIPGFWLHDGA